jgi:hypothetical protein
VFEGKTATSHRIRWRKTDAKQKNVSTMGGREDPFCVKGRCSDRRELMKDQGRSHHDSQQQPVRAEITCTSIVTVAVAARAFKMP